MLSCTEAWSLLVISLLVHELRSRHKAQILTQTSNSVRTHAEIANEGRLQATKPGTGSAHVTLLS